MPDRIAFSWHFEPVVQIEERVLLLTNTKKIPAKVTWVEPVPFLEKDFGAISAGSTTDETEVEEVYVEDGEFAQWRMTIETDNVVLYKHSCPRATPYYSTKKSSGIVPYASSYGLIEPIKRYQLTEFFQYQDLSRYMVLMNTGTSDVTESKVAFFGYIFQFEELDKIEKPYTAIPCVARPTRGGQ